MAKFKSRSLYVTDSAQIFLLLSRFPYFCEDLPTSEQISLLLSRFFCFCADFLTSEHISLLLSTFLYFCADFVTSEHISLLLSTFPYFCADFVTSEHISLLLSTFPYFCADFVTSEQGSLLAFIWCRGGEIVEVQGLLHRYVRQGSWLSVNSELKTLTSLIHFRIQNSFLFLPLWNVLTDD